jgi:hypothetical protein
MDTTIDQDKLGSYVWPKSDEKNDAPRPIRIGMTQKMCMTQEQRCAVAMHMRMDEYCNRTWESEDVRSSKEWLEDLYAQDPGSGEFIHCVQKFP